MTNKGDIKLGVSLYSYQDNYYFHRYDLEGCLAAAAGAGATGIEIFPDAMIPEWPYISDSFVDRFNGMLERYGLKCVCVDHFSDTRMWKNKNLSDDDLYNRGVMYIKAAAKLGAPAIRLLHEEHVGVALSGVAMQNNPLKRDYHLTTVDIVERLLPVAAEYNVMMALECHAPTSVSDPCHEPYLETAERLGLPFVGLQADFSSYEYCVSTADVGQYIRQGATAEILDFYRNSQRDAYFKGEKFNLENIFGQIEKMRPNAVDRQFFDFIKMFDTGLASYETLKQYASKLVYVHGKFYDLDENGQVDNMDYPQIFKALVDGGYKGYICSEFEGNRRMNDAGWVDEIEYVRRHHQLMRKCLGNAY